MEKALLLQNWSVLWSEYFDAYFFNAKDQWFTQISFDAFYLSFIDAKKFDTVHFCEFATNEN